MNNHRRILSIAAFALLPLVLFLAACPSAGTIITYIEDGLSIISSALPVLTAADPGIPADVITQAGTWIDLANSSLADVATIEASPSSPAEKAAAITAELLGVVAKQPQIPAKYAAIAAVVSSVAASIQKILSSLPQPTVGARLSSKSAPVSVADRKRLMDAVSVAEKNRAALAKFHR